jgi:broad specificity phosphatase PhoE
MALRAPDYTVNIIRHGLSCTNLYRYATGAGLQVDERLNEKDPHLSYFGILQAIELRKRLLASRPPGQSPGPDHILTSYLRRAIETALILYAPRDLLLQQYPELSGVEFGEWFYIPTITVIPYISEIGEGASGVRDGIGEAPGSEYENKSVGLSRLRQEFRTFREFLDFGTLEAMDPNCSSQYDHANFLNILYSYPLHSKVAVISHGNVMLQLLARIHQDNYRVWVPNNTELWPIRVTDREMEMYAEPIRPTLTLRVPLSRTDLQKYDRRCRLVGKQTAGRHDTSPHPKRTRRRRRRTTHKGRTIRR